MSDFTTGDPSLAELLKESAKRKMTPADKFWQKVSFVMSGMPEGTDRDELAQKLAEDAGFDAPPPQKVRK